jgi:hypothetical protein
VSLRHAVHPVLLPRSPGSATGENFRNGTGQNFRNSHQQPSVGPSARQLGIRPSDIQTDATGIVVGGGLSVAPDSLWNLPPHRRPRRLGKASTGPSADRVYSLPDDQLPSAQLAALRDAPDHALAVPQPVCTVGVSELRLASTRSMWVENEAAP